MPETLSVDSLSPMLDAMKGFGAAGPVVGLLLWLFWQERAERKALGTKVLDITAASIEAEKDMTLALNTLAGRLAK